MRHGSLFAIVSSMYKLKLKTANNLKFFTSLDSNRTIVFSNFGRYASFISSDQTSLDLAINLLLFKSTTSLVSKSYTNYKQSLDETKAG